MNNSCRIWSGVFLFAIVLSGQAQPISDKIRINQLGFYPLAPKTAVIVGPAVSDKFYILSAISPDTVYRGALGVSMGSRNSSLSTKVALFTAFQKPGIYRLYIPGIGLSYSFTISRSVHGPAVVASLKGYYYQRASMPLEQRFAGKWARPAGHPDTAVLIHASAVSTGRPEGMIIRSPGGWYDAGDYNKYVVNSGITMGTLLSAYEDFPEYFDSLKTNIPENGNGVPDILNEILYNLRWMFTMQDPNDGGVYHKCTNAAFDGMVMPGVTQLPRYVVQKGTAATLDFAAVMAQAARIFASFGKPLPGLADSCLGAAAAAWNWAEGHPAIIYDQTAMNLHFDPKITTGAYGDNRVTDEWFWAAAELYISSGKKDYYKIVTEKLNDTLALPSWSRVYLLGYYSLIRGETKDKKKTGDELAQIRTRLLDYADRLIPAVAGNAFQTVMGQSPGDFIWGSNSVAANQAILLIQAYLLTKKIYYLDDALSNLDYLLGRNATGFCFVTGLGSHSPMHPHHRPSVADGIAEPVPGLLAGGPNPGKQDHCFYPFTEPETAYVDSDCAYASNEIAINWNAPLVYLIAALEALQSKAGYSK